MGEWKQIPNDKPLEPGDKVRLTFSAPGPWWIKATEGAVIEASLTKKEAEGYRLRRIDYNTPGKMIFYFDIIKTNPVIVTVLVVTGSVMLCAAAASLVFEKGEQFFDSPAVASISSAILVAAVIYLLKVLRK